MRAVLGDGEHAFESLDADTRGKTEGAKRRKFVVGAGIGVGAHHGDPMGRLDRIAERDGGEIADVTVAFELPPGPAVALFVDDEALTEQSLGVERRAGRRTAAQRRAGGDDSPAHAGDIALGLDGGA